MTSSSRFYAYIFIIFSIVHPNVFAQTVAQSASQESTTTPTSTTKGISKTLLDAVKEFADWKNDIKTTHPDCFSGDERSPVNIDVVKAIPVQYSPLKFTNYNTTGLVRQRKFENFTEAVFGFRSWRNPPTISGGGLPYNYYLEEIHWAVSEWSSHSPIKTGHTINGAYHFMEAHFVHVREGFRLDEARNIPGHVAIIGVFFEVTVNSTSRPEKNKKMSALDQPLFGKDSMETPYDFVPPSVLLPWNTEGFYRYNGSFAHPPCSTGVIWTIIIEPVVISHYQLYKFVVYSTRTRTPIPISYLVDEAPALNGRTVYLNYGQSSGISRVLIYRRENSFSLVLIPLLFIIVTFVIVLVLYVRFSRPRGIMSFDNIALEDIPDK